MRRWEVHEARFKIFQGNQDNQRAERKKHQKHQGKTARCLVEPVTGFRLIRFSILTEGLRFDRNTFISNVDHKIMSNLMKL